MNDTPNIRTARLGDLGRFIASRTGDPQAATIDSSSVKQLRYDEIVLSLTRDPVRRAAFSRPELVLLVDRIANTRTQDAAMIALGGAL